MWRSHYNCVCEISIPYGAIKRFTFSHSLFIFYKFQFLMVRLKAIAARTAAPIAAAISIPYGAIKRVSSTNRNCVNPKFQFLMVRLKASSLVLTSFKEALFQFLMVRLKAYPLLALSMSFAHFNSLWCD